MIFSCVFRRNLFTGLSYAKRFSGGKTARVAVSAAVARLEKELGVDLVRRTRPIEIAPEVVTLGKLLVTTADKMEPAITDIQCRRNLLPVIRIGLHFPLLLPSRERKTILIIHAFDLRK